MSSQKVLMEDRPRRGPPPAPDRAWRALWLFSWVLVAAGLGDTVLAFVPMRFGVPEWEFGTVASSFSALPLITMGFAGLLSSAIARGSARAAMILGWALIVLVFVVLALFLVFLSDAPIALAQVRGDIRFGIIKAIVKTSWLGLIFATCYFVGGIAALRYARSQSST